MHYGLYLLWAGEPALDRGAEAAQELLAFLCGLCFSLSLQVSALAFLDGEL